MRGQSLSFACVDLRQENMTRLAGVVAPGYPHDFTQRGNRRQQTLFSSADYADHVALMSASCTACGTDVWAYCLSPATST